MRAHAFMLADAVSPGEGGKVFIHGGGLSRIEADTFPWTQPQIAVYLALEREDEELGSDHRLLIRLYGVDGEALNEMPMSFRLEPPLDEQMPERVFFATTIHGIRFRKPGVYSLALLIDDEEIAREPLRVGTSQ